MATRLQCRQVLLILMRLLSIRHLSLLRPRSPRVPKTSRPSNNSWPSKEAHRNRRLDSFVDKQGKSTSFMGNGTRRLPKRCTTWDPLRPILGSLTTSRPLSSPSWTRKISRAIWKALLPEQATFLALVLDLQQEARG